MDPIKRGAIAGIIAPASVIFIVLLLVFLSVIVLSGQMAFHTASIIFLGIISILMVVAFYCVIAFYYAFCTIGVKAKIPFLRKISQIYLIFAFVGGIILSLFFLTLLPSALRLTGNVIAHSASSSTELQEFSNLWLYHPILIVTLILLGLASMTLTVLFNIGIMQLNKLFPFAKPTGIIGIVGIFFSPLKLASYVMQIILLFQISKKYEK